MRTLLFVLALAMGGIFGFGQANAADGDLDPSFLTDAELPGYGFYVNPNWTPHNTLDSLGAVVERPDKKLWAVGRMRAQGAYRLSLYLVEPDGSADVGFGDLGLRTVVGPCADFQVASATLDAQNRLLVAVDRCPDFTVYRFLSNGDLDASFAAGGKLTVAFDAGGSNEDVSQGVVSAANGDIIIAGAVSTANSSSLGVARFTDAGQPVASFGVGGKKQISFEWRVPSIRGMNGLHLMADGRIVIAGAMSETSQAVSDKKQFVVRLLSDGTMDPSFGNSAAGLSKINLKTPLAVIQSPQTSASLMERDGSIIQVGSIVSNNVNSSTDIFLLRWRADGQLDTSIGPSGTRQYALDFAGPNPVEPGYNSDWANNILRQDNGDYVIVADTDVGTIPGTAVMRLKSNFSLDKSFGTDGKIQHLVQIIASGEGLFGEAMVLQKGRILIGGVVVTGTNGRMQMIMGLQHDEIFADTFD